VTMGVSGALMAEFAVDKRFGYFMTPWTSACSKCSCMSTFRIRT
jgi:hypothetical protein